MQATAGWTEVTGRRQGKKQRENTKSMPPAAENEMVVGSPKDTTPKVVPAEVVSPLTNIHPEAITAGCISPPKSADVNINVKPHVDTNKEHNSVEVSMSRFPSPNRKRRVSLVESLEAAVAAPVAPISVRYDEEQEVHDDVQATLPKWIEVPPVESQTPLMFGNLERRIWQSAQVASQSPTQLVLESPSKSLALANEVFNFPGSPKTDLEYKQILACHGKGSPKCASLETCDVAELKQLIEKGPPGLAPPRASEAESARRLAGAPQPSWAKVAAGGLANSSEGAPNTGELMDVVLMECFLQAIRTRVKAWNLPIKGTTLYTQHMRQCRRLGTSLNVKESTFHFLGAFLQHLEKQGLLTLKKGETDAVIVDICRNHPEIVAWQPWPEEATHEGLGNLGEMTEQHQMPQASFA
eukprot:gnl/MRDRNA2_/MRDRNA2_89600_c0_seq1.p1 gnl/MRDRNA2_/MRDRNA2_89600_c0~~gnl/MRDRNA2_/MRDRNA2_89600_c0_seq1.p1  ORF type:complete len:411 (+),score=100.96 gnl/MRDRNA2_/MRDRNA2_89600_c0_seq1:79-1311(+)